MQTQREKTKKKPARKRDTTRRLTEAEKLAIVAIHAQTGSERKTAELSGCSSSTVNALVRNYRDSHPELVERVKRGMAGKLYDAADKLVDHASDNIDGLNAYQSTIAAGVMIDKARLIEGQSTENLAHAIQIVDYAAAIKKP